MEVQEESLLSVSDVARLLNVPECWVYVKTEQRRIRHFKVGRYLRFRQSDIEDYLDAVRRGSDEK